MKLWLSHPALGDFQLTEAPGVRAATLDDRTPAARVATSARTNSDGENDNTAYHGARAVTVSLHLIGWEDGAGPVEDLIDALAAYTVPDQRPWLYKDGQNGRPVRRIRLRGDSMSAPRDIPGYAAVQASWSAPSGVWESAEQTVATVPAGSTPEAGLAHPRRYPKVYPTTSIAGAVAVTNAGNRPCAPIMRLPGPCTDPKLVNLTTGLQQSLVGLSLAVGQYAEVDVANSTIRLNGRPAESLDAYRDWANTSFWWLAPGINYIRYVPATYDTPTPQAELVFRETYF